MGMKMAAVSTISLLLLCCSFISSTDSQTCHLYATKGSSVTVPMVSTLDKTDTLKWLHNNKLIFYRKPSVLVDGKEESVSKDGSLLLTNVKESDGGDYIPQVFDNNGKTKGTFKVKRLCVMDPPPKPSVNFVCEEDGLRVKFTCVVKSKAKDLTYAWLQNDKVLDKEKSQTLRKPIDQIKTVPISCKVSNLASFMTSAPVTHTCVDTTSIFPDELFGINTWILVGAGGGIVLVLIIIIIVCCICTKRRKRFRMKDERELRLAWTNEQPQHNHPPDHHHHPHQQPAGNTGPRQQRSKQHRDQQRPRAPNHLNAQPQPSPRRPAQAPRPPPCQADEDQPPPLPQPRKGAKIQRV